MKLNSVNQIAQVDSLTVDELIVQRKLAAHLDAQVYGLDSNVTHKLSVARCKALSGQRRNGYRYFGSVGVKRVAATLSAIVLIVSFSKLLYNIESDASLATVAANQTTRLVEDLNLFSALDDIEFYESVEFLEWMESNAG